MRRKDVATAVEEINEALNFNPPIKTTNIKMDELIHQLKEEGNDPEGGFFEDDPLSESTFKVLSECDVTIKNEDGEPIVMDFSSDDEREPTEEELKEIEKEVDSGEEEEGEDPVDSDPDEDDEEDKDESDSDSDEEDPEKEEEPEAEEDIESEKKEEKEEKPKKKKRTKKHKRGRPATDKRRSYIYAEDEIITVLVDQNPHHANSEAYKRFEMMYDGMTVGEYLDKGGLVRDLVQDRGRRNIEIEYPDEE